MGDLPFARKSLGQHWLTDQASLVAMCDTAAVDKNDTLLEIGPGLGTLTAELVKHARQVIAVELDEGLAQELPARVPASNLKVLTQDILKFDLAELPIDYKVVANIPYYLTSHLLRYLSEAKNPPAMAVLLMQQEVAERVAAGPGDLSFLGVMVQWYWTVELGQPVPAHLFTPSPRVDSQIVMLRRRAKPLFDGVVAKAFFRIVQAGFAQRRKTLLNSLSAGLRLPRARVREILNASTIAPNTRPQDLSLDQWHTLYQHLTR